MGASGAAEVASLSLSRSPSSPGREPVRERQVRAWIRFPGHGISLIRRRPVDNTAGSEKISA